MSGFHSDPDVFPHRFHYNMRILCFMRIVLCGVINDDKLLRYLLSRRKAHIHNMLCRRIRLPVCINNIFVYCPEFRLEP